jgi:hypothetical protein
MSDWRTATGYPGPEASTAVWEAEFARRAGRQGIPFFQLANGLREALRGPIVLQVGDDGAVQADSLLPPQRHMALVFLLDRPMEEQIDRARRLLQGNQRARFPEAKARLRADKLATYLRVLDADAAGAHAVEIGTVIWPWMADDLGDDHRRRKHARETLAAARRLMRRWGSRTE